MKSIVSYKLVFLLGVVLTISGLFSACKKEPIVSVVSSNLNITGYIEKNQDKFSEFKKVLEITNTAGFLQAYGNYTLFLPTNEGVKTYLQELGKNSVDQLDAEELKKIVRFHLVEDTINTTFFGDGKLPKVTMLGQYVVTGANNQNGEAKVTVNRQANLVTGNIRLGNGYVHVIDNVLRPAKLTLAETIKEDPNYSIFYQALEETGLYDTLNYLPANHPDPRKQYLTVIAESNAVLTAAGYPSYSALKAKYNTGAADLKNASNGLHAFMAYHILFGAKYLTDIANSQGHKTLSEPEVLSAKYANKTLLLNDVVFNQQYEPGFLLNKAMSDVSASNGVLHSAAPYTPTGAPATTGHFFIKKREPFRVDWDLADFPEVRAMVSVFRKGGTAGFDKPSASAPAPIKGWDWANKTWGPAYRSGSTWVYGDYLNLPIGVSSRNDWMQFVSPVVVKGKYNIWVCYRRQNQSGRWPTSVGTKCRLIIDGEVVPKPFFFAEPPPQGSSAELETLGWKYYTSNGTAAPFEKQRLRADGTTDNSPWVAKNLGIVTIKSTETHVVRMEALLSSQNANNIDMIQFIPIDAPSQILPRFRQDGSEDFTNYPGTH